MREIAADCSCLQFLLAGSRFSESTLLLPCCSNFITKELIAIMHIYHAYCF